MRGGTVRSLNFAVTVALVMGHQSISHSAVVGLPQAVTKEAARLTESMAIAGSGEAAMDMLGRHVLLMGMDKMYWAEIAAENGSLSGALACADQLGWMPDSDFNEESELMGYRRDRRWFWLNWVIQRAPNSPEAAEARSYLQKDFVGFIPISYPSPVRSSERERASSIGIERARLAAMQGNQNAAYRVTKHYVTAGDALRAKRWAAISLQNGDRRAIAILVELLDKSSVERDRRRSSFWKTIKSNGLGSD